MRKGSIRSFELSEVFLSLERVDITKEEYTQLKQDFKLKKELDENGCILSCSPFGATPCHVQAFAKIKSQK